ncbi:MAG: type II toxin-antitoxin system RelE/ParE family toxin [Methylomonas sp.]|jgi:plasmid stabilization system protein ParE
MKLAITEDAKADLMEIKDFIRPHNPKWAESLIEELLDKCAVLCEMPCIYGDRVVA